MAQSDVGDKFCHACLFAHMQSMLPLCAERLWVQLAPLLYDTPIMASIVIVSIGAKVTKVHVLNM
jgi:hypothetical protein